MTALTSKQKKYLKSLAHHLKPVVYIGKLGLTDNVIVELDRTLNSHELIKLKFIDFKDEKKELSNAISEKSGSIVVSLIGNILILFRQNKDEDKRKITLK